MTKYVMSSPKLKNPFTINQLIDEENKSNKNQNKMSKRRRKSDRSYL